MVEGLSSYMRCFIEFPLAGSYQFGAQLPRRYRGEVDAVRSAIEANVRLAMEYFGPGSGIDFGLNRASLQLLEDVLERQRAVLGDDPHTADIEQLVSLVGSFLGACILAETDGDWHVHEDGDLGILLPNGKLVFPFTKARKAIRSGADGGESIAQFHRNVVDVVAAGKLDQPVSSIPRHEYPTENAAEGSAVLEETVSWLLEDLGEPDNTRRAMALNTTLTLAKSRCLVDPEAAKFETWEAWVTAMQTGSALFAAATTPEDSSVIVRIRKQAMTLPAIGPESCVRAGSWVTAFYLALICRENQRLAELAQVPVSLLRESLRGSGAVFPEYIYAWVETLQSFWLGRPDMSDKLVAAIEGTDPQTARIDGPDQEAAPFVDEELLLKINYPPIILFYRYLQKDHEEFNKALAEALQWHKEYWTATEDRAISADGLVALGPLAIACLAHDAGFPVEINSEYLPTALLKHMWAGELDT
ncbi:immunity 49 family protein [Nocardia gipuzkoensis]|uniref:immunity 49 family protein n=1 Tax=Nocardia gipuzkoensis TaxID=2749991 RepID=UPI003EE145EF